ncbi:chitin deacetylase [Lunasporangiospora selenospora]|uniref:Chitin deacetylase n=1 Tax=Lunasporangiospora selenospora TaxID=979761 RepID=A0A9P6FPR5_9FUNG|nr:chitin deacetylase [Lunasporangiospora selenospora]
MLPVLLSTIALLLSSSSVLVQAIPAAEAAVSIGAAPGAPSPSSPGTINMSDYPSPSAIPPTDSDQVKKWLSEIDLSGAPSIPHNVGEPPSCPAKIEPGVCYWTCEDCAADDVVDCPDPNHWGLTFDDGPTPATPDLLDFLKAQSIKATFFLIGGNVIKYPKTVVDEVQAGHHLASHTALTTLTNEQIVAEIKWTEKAIEEATGYRVRYMRPPYGDIDNRVRYVLRQLGYTVVDWGGDTFDSEDWKIPQVSETKVVSDFQASITTYSQNLTNSRGFISLEHDLTSVTVGVAKTLIPFGLQKNLTILSVAECLKDATPYKAVNGVPMVPGSVNTTAPANGTTIVTNSGSPASSGSGQDGLDLKNHKSSLAAHTIEGRFLWVTAAAAGAFLYTML